MPIAKHNTFSGKNNKKHLLLVWLFALIIVVSIPPFYFWRISTYIYFFSTVAFFFVELWERPRNQLRKMSFVLFAIFYVYASFNIYEGLGYVGKIWNSYRLFIAFAIFFVSERNWVNIFNCFEWVYAIILLPSLIVYFLVMFAGVNLPHFVISPVNELKDYNYLAYPFLVMTNKFVDSYRFCGYFDEPGVIGNISGVLLAVNRCNMRDWKTWIFLISGVFSFSLFFYALISIYILFFGSWKAKIVFILSGIIAMLFFSANDSLISEYILSRLEIDNNGQLTGDNRTHASFDVFWDGFVHSDKFWFGYGHLYSNMEVDTGGQSFKHLIVDHGIIMSVIYVIAFFFYYLSFNIKKKQILFLMFLLFSILFQRPFISYLLYLFLMIAPASVVKHTFDNTAKTKDRI